MHQPSNLPPGVTDKDIEDQQMPRHKSPHTKRYKNSKLREQAIQELRELCVKWFNEGFGWFDIHMLLQFGGMGDDGIDEEINFCQSAANVFGKMNKPKKLSEILNQVAAKAIQPYESGPVINVYNEILVPLIVRLQDNGM